MSAAPKAVLRAVRMTQQQQGGVSRLPDGILSPDTVLNVFNRKYMLVKEAGKALIFEPRTDPLLQGRRFFDRITLNDFRALYANRSVTLGRDGDGKEILKRPADYWLHHHERRQYLGGVVFRPGHATSPDEFNLWEGFAIEPKPGNWSQLDQHILHVICQDNHSYREWLLNWIACMIQHPAEPAEVCVVLRSGNPIQGSVIVHARKPRRPGLSPPC